jgi:transposase
MEGKMAYRELFVVEVKEILRLWARGHGFRHVARATSLDRKTVRRYVTVARALGLDRNREDLALDDFFVGEVVASLLPGAKSAPGSMRNHCRAHAAAIAGWVKAGARGPKIVRLLTRETGVIVPLRTMQRFISVELGTPSRGRTVWVADGKAGEVLEIDFLLLGDFVDRETGKKRRLYALLCLAPFSRHEFVWPCLGQTQQDVIDGLEAAWRFFGGVFPVLLPDNMKPIVTRADPIAPVLNVHFTEYAQDRGFEVDPARPRRPRDKARVERQVRFVRDDYFGGEKFGSLREAREEAVRWCSETAGMRDHGTTHRQPRVCFEQEELPLLKPVPTELYDQPRWTTATVKRDNVVCIGSALYSVPCKIEDAELRVRIDRATVKMYLANQLVKAHPRQAPGGKSIDPADLPAGKVALATRDASSLQRNAESLGVHVGEYARRLLEAPLPWMRLRRVYALLGLGKRYGGAAVDEACARALELEVVEVPRIAAMLEKGLLRRGLLHVPPPPPPVANNVIALPRFARNSSEWRVDRPTPGAPPDAQA